MIRKATSKKSRRTKPLPSRRLTLRIQLRDIAPLIWREVNVPDEYSLLQLHRCIQLVFGWLDYHLFEFQVGARRFEASNAEAEGEPAEGVALRDLELTAGAQLLYIYDMGDYWEHDVLVQAVSPALPVSPYGEVDLCAYVHAGARAAPPEDAGGAHGYAEAVEAYARRADEEDEAVVTWLGPDFDPERFDRWACNHALVLATAWGVI